MTHGQNEKTRQENATGYFDFERLDAYRLALAAVEIVAARRRRLQGLPGRSGEQLERALAGALTNLCSGAAAQGAEQKRQFRIALCEATEAGGAIELARAYRALDSNEHARLRARLLRLCACLRGLLR
jgi:hypothetical protein